MKKKTQTKHQIFTITRAIILAITVGVFPFMNMVQANASPITGRTIALSSSAADASGITYTFTSSALPTATAVKSVEIKMCDSLPPAGCVTPTNFSASSSTLASQPTGLGAASGWTVDATTAGSLRVINGANATAPSGAVQIVWNTVHNPQATNTTYYALVTTYSGVGFTGALDTGSAAYSTSTPVQVSLTVNEALTFCTGTSITGQNCGTAAGSQVNLGVGSTTTTATGTSIISASTNGNTGYSVAVTGTTLTSGSNTITALTAGGASSQGSKQFGFNMADTNTTPAVGAAKSGTGTAAASGGYGTNNSFKFNSGDTIISVNAPTNSNTFTVGYIANIDGITPAGIYTSNLTYTATANF
ncbi:MAG: hypothetical protein NTV39_00830 [Candidatus Saccharibacteria bacterium]|nr:hypothetical protein [Candidatus Saccharibacteria bacterium]